MIMKMTCKTCTYWKERGNTGFGECLNPRTYSWVRGQSFEPPDYFGCNNHGTAINSILSIQINIEDTNEPNNKM